MPIINVLGGATNFLGFYPDLASLQTAYPTADAGDWAIVDGDPAAVYVWDPSAIPPAWVNSGTAGSIVSVFGRTTPDILAVAGDYNASQITDDNDPYPTAALPYGTTTGITPSADNVKEALWELANDAHTHPNLVNIDTINQDLRTTSNVTFAQVNVVTPGALETQYDAVTMTSGAVSFDLRVRDSAGASNVGLDAAADYMYFYMNGGNAAMYIRATDNEITMADNLVLGNFKTLNQATRLTMKVVDSGGGKSGGINLQPAPFGGWLSYLELDAPAGYGVVTSSDVFIGAYDVTGGDPDPDAAGTYQLTVRNSAEPYATAFESSAASGVMTYWKAGASPVMTAGSRLAIAATGTKAQAMIQANDDLYIRAVGEQLDLQDGSVFINGSPLFGGPKIGINTTSPLYSLDVRENLYIAGKGGRGAPNFDDNNILIYTESPCTISMNTYNGDSRITATRYGGNYDAVLPTTAGRTFFLSTRGYSQTIANGDGQTTNLEGGAYFMEAVGNWSATNNSIRHVFTNAPAGGGFPTEIFEINNTGTLTNGFAKIVDSATAALRLSATSQPVDEKNWHVYSSSGDFAIGTLNDAESAGSTAIQILRAAGTSIAQINMWPATVFQNSFAFAVGPTISSIQTAITDVDTAIPTSGAVIDYLGTAGYVKKTGTPVDNQIAVWTAADTVEGDANFTWTGSALTVVGAFQTLNGAQVVIDIQAAAAKESITINNGAVAFNDGFADLNFAIRKNLSGSAFIYDAGLDTMTMDASVFAMTGGIDATVTVGSDYYNIDATGGSLSLQAGGLGGQGTLLITGSSVALDLGTLDENVFTAVGTGITFNGDFQDLDFTVNKLTSGQAMLYDAGTDALTLDADTATVNAATLLELNALLTDVKQTLRISQLNSGDEILTTDLNGNVQESGIKATTAPAGGSGFTVVEYAVAPVNPPAGFLWMQAKDANTKTLNYYDGVQTYGVDLSV